MVRGCRPWAKASIRLLLSAPTHTSVYPRQSLPSPSLTQATHAGVWMVQKGLV